MRAGAGIGNWKEVEITLRLAYLGNFRHRDVPYQIECIGGWEAVVIGNDVALVAEGGLGGWVRGGGALV